MQPHSQFLRYFDVNNHQRPPSSKSLEFYQCFRHQGNGSMLERQKDMFSLTRIPQTLRTWARLTHAAESKDSSWRTVWLASVASNFSRSFIWFATESFVHLAVRFLIMKAAARRTLVC